MTDGRKFFNNPVKKVQYRMRNFDRSQLIKEMITQQVVYSIIITLIITIKMIAIDLSKQQALNVAPKEIQQISFNVNLDRVGNSTLFFIIEEVKETISCFSQGTVKALKIYFTLI